MMLKPFCNNQLQNKNTLYNVLSRKIDCSCFEHFLDGSQLNFVLFLSIIENVKK